MADEKTEKGRAIDLALSQIEKQFGKGSIMKLGSKGAVVPISVISTGAISFDAALGVGGFPRGRVVEVFGPESSGKTTIALQVIAEAQKQGGMAAFVDADRGVELQRAATGSGFRIAEHDADLFANLVDKDETRVRFGHDTGELAEGLRHQARLQADVAVAHLAVELGLGHQRGHRIHHQHVEGA